MACLSPTTVAATSQQEKVVSPKTPAEEMAQLKVFTRDREVIVERLLRLEELQKDTARKAVIQAERLDEQTARIRSLVVENGELRKDLLTADDNMIALKKSQKQQVLEAVEAREAWLGQAHKAALQELRTEMENETCNAEALEQALVATENFWKEIRDITERHAAEVQEITADHERQRHDADARHAIELTSAVEKVKAENESIIAALEKQLQDVNQKLETGREGFFHDLCEAMGFPVPEHAANPKPAEDVCINPAAAEIEVAEQERTRLATAAKALDLLISRHMIHRCTLLWLSGAVGSFVVLLAFAGMVSSPATRAAQVPILELPTPPTGVASFSSPTIGTSSSSYTLNPDLPTAIRVLFPATPVPSNSPGITHGLGSATEWVVTPTATTTTTTTTTTMSLNPTSNGTAPNLDMLTGANKAPVLDQIEHGIALRYPGNFYASLRRFLGIIANFARFLTIG